VEPVLHEPGIGKAIWDLTLAMTANATLTDSVRQIVILVVGARFDAAYEIYAHIAVAEHEGMRPDRLATLAANLKPTDLSEDETVAFDVGYKLVRSGTLPEPFFSRNAWLLYLTKAGMVRRINGSLGFCIMAEFTSAPTYSTAILGQVRENLIAPPQSCLRS
jgi:alkylhydroperoxidase family enzyme